jgi:hypothetical protein
LAKVLGGKSARQLCRAVAAPVIGKEAGVLEAARFSR